MSREPTARDDKDVQAQVSELLATVHEPLGVIAGIAEFITRHTGSHGLKLYSLERSPAGLQIEQIYRSDAKKDEESPQPMPLDPDEGLGDWVIVNNDWLAILSFEEGRALEEGRGPHPAQSGKHGQVRVKARLRRDVWPKSDPADNETSMLLMPLVAKSGFRGAVAVWRESSHPYDLERDLDALQASAPHLASICAAYQTERRAQDKLSATRELASSLDARRTSLAQACDCLLDSVLTLTRAHSAVLLQHDPARPGQFYFSSVRMHPEVGSPEVVSALRETLSSTHEKLDQWPSHDWEPLVARVNRDVRNSPSSDNLAALQALPLPSDGEIQGAIILIARAHGLEFEGLSVELLEPVSETFLEYAGTLFIRHVHSHALTIAEGTRNDSDEDPERKDVLGWAARILHDVTGAEAALVYRQAGPNKLDVSVYPKIEGFDALLTEEGSLTRECIERKQSARVLDVHDKRDSLAKKLNRTQLDRMCAKLAWQVDHMRSWLCVPVLDDQGSSVGALKVLTTKRGIFLGTHHERLVNTLAKRAAWEVTQDRRQRMRKQLNALANDLASKEGAELAELMVQGLECWFDAFLRLPCRVAIVARTQGPQPDDVRPLLDGFSESLGTEVRQELEVCSRYMVKSILDWKQEITQGMIGNLHYVAAPIGLPGDDVLQGHVFVLGTKPFERADATAAKEAVREMAIVLNSERYRRAWTLTAARFRHAVLGSVQGVVSSAKLLGKLAQQAVEEEVRKEQAVRSSNIGALVDECVRRIDEESVEIRLWREYQRLYATDPPQIQCATQALQPIVERCVSRFKERFKEKINELHLQWMPRGPVKFSFDGAALDIVLSNLLDNAARFALENQLAVVSVETTDTHIVIWVQDIGHIVPEDGNIYDSGKKLSWQDPFREFGGQGVGLPMAKALIEQHRGTLTHECEPVAHGKKEETRRYRVRFTIKLPHGWKTDGSKSR